MIIFARSDFSHFIIRKTYIKSFVYFQQFPIISSKNKGWKFRSRMLLDHCIIPQNLEVDNATITIDHCKLHIDIPLKASIFTSLSQLLYLHWYDQLSVFRIKEVWYMQTYSAMHIKKLCRRKWHKSFSKGQHMLYRCLIKAFSF